MDALKYIVILLMNKLMNIFLKTINPNYIDIEYKEEEKMINDINTLFFE